MMDDREVGQYWDENAAEWTRGVRAGYDVFREYVSMPAFLAILPDLSDERVLDVGCGEGYNTRILADLCGEIIGIDVSEKMVAAAREAESGEPRGIEYHTTSGNDLGMFEDGSFDAVVSTMAMMDMADYEGCIRECARVLKSGGLLQFSILHPIAMMRGFKWIENDQGKRVCAVVGDYFGLEPTKPGSEVEEWVFSAAPAQVQAKAKPFRIPQFFRTISEYFNALTDAGFQVARIEEPYADERMAKEYNLNETRIVPWFMIFQCLKQ